MASMDALLKIKAVTEGEGGVTALARSFTGLQAGAERASGGLRSMLNSAGSLSGALGSLVPLASGAGLIAMAKHAVDLGDDMNDMAQKTGVSVEQLSKFKQAAESSGTSVEGVTSAMIKLNRNMATDKAAKTFKELGIASADASGKLKTTDEIMLEVAEKFKSMPDGAAKTAAAMALFGKSGADMIPMLNGGRASIESLTATMSTSFAKGADQLNDKMAALQAKFLQLGVGVGTALMPAFNALTDVVVGIANAFSQLPEPIQGVTAGVIGLTAAFVVLAPAINTVIALAGVLSGLELGATIGGWLGIVGPAVAAVTTALGGLLAWIGGTLIPGLVAFFSGPVGWTVLAVAAVVAMVVLFKEPIMQFLGWLGERVGAAFNFVTDIAKTAFQVLYAIAWQIWVQPWINLWNVVLREPATNALTWLQGVWTGFIKFFNGFVIQPIGKAWNGLMDMLRNAMTAIAEFFPRLWNGAINAVRNVINGFLGAIANTINGIIANVNRLIDAFNKLPGPDIPLVPTLSVPKFATGGYVTGPTLSLIGEGGQPEYIIPADQMANASASYMAGARGAAVLQGGGGAPQITIQTGPVMQLDGKQYVTVEDLQRTAQQVAEGVIGRLRTPAARLALGMR